MFAQSGDGSHQCRALAMFNYEEKQKRESQILADFRQLVQAKLGDYS